MATYSSTLANLPEALEVEELLSELSEVLADVLSELPLSEEEPDAEESGDPELQAANAKAITAAQLRAAKNFKDFFIIVLL